MLVDADTGQLLAVSHRAVAAHREQAEAPEADAPQAVEQELFLQQLETGTAPCDDISELVADIRRCRRTAADAARAAGADLVAVGTPVLGGQDRQVTPKDRYQRIVEEFGEIGRQGSVCGMHVHVDVADDEEAVRVIDRLRPWLPVLRALSVNSIDYSRADFADGSRQYDVIVDIGGNTSLSRLRNALTADGTLVIVGGEGGGRWLGGTDRQIRAMLLSPFVKQRLGTFISSGNGADLPTLTDLIEAGRLTPAIDRTFPLSEAAKAIAYVEAGHARGKVVITV